MLICQTYLAVGSNKLRSKNRIGDWRGGQCRLFLSIPSVGIGNSGPQLVFGDYVIAFLSSPWHYQFILSSTLQHFPSLLFLIGNGKIFQSENSMPHFSFPFPFSFPNPPQPIVLLARTINGLVRLDGALQISFLILTGREMFFQIESWYRRFSKSCLHGFSYF